MPNLPGDNDPADDYTVCTECEHAYLDTDGDEFTEDPIREVCDGCFLEGMSEILEARAVAGTETPLHCAACGNREIEIRQANAISYLAACYLCAREGYFNHAHQRTKEQAVRAWNVYQMEGAGV